jgi:acetylornithine deacetylase/succinyl-diaminopimelate desuccinylase-like protein
VKINSPGQSAAVSKRALIVFCLAIVGFAFVGALPVHASWLHRSAEKATTPPGSKVPGGSSPDAIPADRMREYSDLAVKWMQEYLRINTTNPPGNEAKAAAFFKEIFDAEGIENRVFEYAPGRANIWARIPHTPGTEAKRPLILLNHMDVVSSEPSHWRVPPFSGEIVDGSIYGRGAQDMKNEGLAQMMVMVMLKREQAKLDRDVIFLATADEEVDDTGSEWMIANKRALLGNAEYLITEGGENLLQSGKAQYVGVDVAEKAPFWLHVVAHGQPGHGSRPIPDSAPNRLIAALQRINAYEPGLKLIPVVEQSLQAMAPFEPPDRAQIFRNIRQEIQDPNVLDQIRHDESLDYMFQDTIALTMLGGSAQTNVIPNEAWANIDVRLLPGTDPQQFLESIRKVVNDANVTVDPLKGFSQANASPTGTPLWNAIVDASKKYFDGAPVIPKLTSGYTENQLYRQLGIVCYGFSPYTATEAEGDTEHGDNERIRVEEVRRGPRVLYDVVTQVAGAK